MEKKMKLSIVIPCYDEEKVLPLTLEQLNDISISLDLRDDITKIEFVIVDDGSCDGTFELLTERSKKDQRLKVVRFSKNFGHQAALLAGYEVSKGDVIVSLDADLQHPPELIPIMLDKINDGNDIVSAVRKTRETDLLFKRFSAEIFYWIMKKFGVNIISGHADYRMVTRRALNAFLQFQENNLFIRATFPIVGFPSCTVSYDCAVRTSGETKYSFRRMFEFAIDGITSFSVVPLRICSITGLFISFLALIMLFWIISAKIFGTTVPGWTSTVVPIYLLGGVQLLFLGIVGEYIGKIYSEVKNRPRYIIQETINFSENDHQN